MDPDLRKLFNESFSPALYQKYTAELSRRLSVSFEYRLAETPVFLPRALRERCETAARAILDQLREASRIERMKRAIPAEWDTPRMDALPSIAQIDFAVVRDTDGTLAPRLIELQGFPSLACFEVIQRDVWAEMLASLPGLNRGWSCWFSGLNRESFLELLRRTILGAHDPEHVILMDLDPRTQKTLPDFLATRLLLGIDAVCPTTLLKKGRTLWREGARGESIPVKRIYNRVVIDELVRKKTALPFDYRDDLDVEWVPHPNWFWVWSKYSLPFLNHPAAPKSVLLSDLGATPRDLTRRFVLKPLFSFAGGGVNVAPTARDLVAVSSEERDRWCLQEKVRYEPALQAADGGGVKVEIRMMFFRPDDQAEMVLGENLARLSRGNMMGVDFNKNFTWVGSSVCLWEE